MLVNQQVLAGIYKSFRTIFNDAFNSAKPFWQDLATEVPSTTKEEVYKWLGQMPRMREWLGERVIQNLSAHEWAIKNRDFELTIEVDRNDIEDDSIGIYRPLFQQMGQAGATHPDDLIVELLVNGFSQECYDGQYFFDTDHPLKDGSVQSNKGTLALSSTSYSSAYAAMMSLKGEDGKPLGVTPTHLVIPPQLRETALQILKAERLANGQTNVNRNSAEPIILPDLAAHPTYWFLLDLSKPLRPFIVQIRKKPEFVAKNKPDDENVFMRKKYLYGIDSRDNAGYGLWQLAYGSTGGA